MAEAAMTHNKQYEKVNVSEFKLDPQSPDVLVRSPSPLSYYSPRMDKKRFLDVITLKGNSITIERQVQEGTMQPKHLIGWDLVSVRRNELMECVESREDIEVGRFSIAPDQAAKLLVLMDGLAKRR